MGGDGNQTLRFCEALDLECLDWRLVDGSFKKWGPVFEVLV